MLGEAETIASVMGEIRTVHRCHGFPSIPASEQRPPLVDGGGTATSRGTQGLGASHAGLIPGHATLRPRTSNPDVRSPALWTFDRCRCVRRVEDRERSAEVVIVQLELVHTDNLVSSF
jgi:hypothetical protein